ncbi:hypothetical protein Fmac_020625 [Flemingia macrophylla]|uniref:Uncharacterized protein n=1 Tax=Flemingia macrophylla TaxID=520843 RepID=A0ABD1LV37_9FABA
MSTTEVTSPRISFELCAIQPPEHPTYDLKGIIKLALSEDVGDLGFLAHIRWSGVTTMEISSIKGYSLEKFKGKVSEEAVVVVKILAEDCPNQGTAICLEDVCPFKQDIPLCRSKSVEDPIPKLLDISSSFLRSPLQVFIPIKSEKGNINVYGFFEPQSIQKSGNNMVETQTYMRHGSKAQKTYLFSSLYQWLFKDAHSLPRDEILEIREDWARFLLQFRSSLN